MTQSNLISDIAKTSLYYIDLPKVENLNGDKELFIDAKSFIEGDNNQLLKCYDVEVNRERNSFNLLANGFEVITISDKLSALLSSCVGEYKADIKPKAHQEIASMLETWFRETHQKDYIVIPVDLVIRNLHDKKFKPIIIAHIDFPRVTFNTETIDTFKWNIDSSISKAMIDTADMVNVWMPIQYNDDFPLAVIDKSTVSEGDKVVYNAPRQNAQIFKAVAMQHSNNHRWYAPKLIDRKQAIIFQTLHTPHAAIKLADNPNRTSAEVRCLLLKKNPE